MNSNITTANEILVAALYCFTGFFAGFILMARITIESRSNLAQIPRGSNAISTYLARYSDAFLAPVQLMACKAL